MTTQDSQQLTLQDYRPAIVGGRYRVTSLLRTAEHGDVVGAVDVREDREVVLKRLRSPSRAQGTRLRQVERVLSGLKSPSLMQIRDLKEGRQDSWLVSDRVPGLELLSWWAELALARSDGFSARWDHIAPLLHSALAALELLHRSELAHLDLKPANLRVDSLGRAVLVDIGFADAGESTSPGLRARLSGYEAPELVAGGTGSPASDLWSLGAVLCRLLTGRLPDERAGLGASLKSRLPDISDSVDAVVLRLLQEEPSDRYESIEAVRKDLGDSLVGPSKQPLLPWSVQKPVLVGREAQLGFFRKLLAELEHRGRGGLVVLEAERGAGKTRLLEAWSDLAGSRTELEVFSASCLPDAPRRVLDRWFSPPPSDISKPPSPDIVDKALACLTRPTVLLLDTLECLDASSWARVHRAAAAAALGRVPVLVVLSGRELPLLQPRIPLDTPRVFRVPLPRLTPANVSLLLRPESPDDEDLQVRDGAAESYCQEAGGIPERLLEVLLQDEAQGRLVREGRRWAVRLGQAASEPPRPPLPRLHEVFLAAIELLGSPLELGIALSCLPFRRQEAVSHLSYGADNGTLSFRWIRGTWFVELTERFKSRPVDVYGVPALRGAAARWLEQNDEAPLAAERAAKQWHKAGEYRKAAAAYSRSALSESVLGNTADARRLDGISRTLEARAGVLGMSPG